MKYKLTKPVSGREAALQVVAAAEQGSYVNLALKEVLSSAGLSKKEKNLATEISYGVIRHLNTLCWLVERFLRTPLNRLTPWIRGVLLCGAYQLFYLDKIPESAIVNESVNMAKKYGHKGVAGLVNGVLRRLVREKDAIPWPDPEDDPIGSLILKGSHPGWMVERWNSRWGLEEVKKLVAANNIPLPVTIRVNPLRTDINSLQAELAEDGVAVSPGMLPQSMKLINGGSLSSTEAFKKGHFTIQGEASMLASMILNPAPGETVLDLCSAPGGKTTHMAELMKDTGRIIACDIYPGRLNLVENSAARLRLSCIETRVWDGRESADKAVGKVDKVLLDAPCSGLGIIRKKPDLKWKRKKHEIKQLAALQAQLLDSAAAALKAGGSLVYAVCTLEQEETKMQISSFLKRHKEFQPDLETKRMVLNQLDNDGLGLYILPHRRSMDGFYLSRLIRRSSS